MSEIKTYRCKYNPQKDIMKVSPIGSLDLKQAFANNAIPADLSVRDGHYNDIDSPEAISTRVKDKIDAEILDRSVKAYKPEQNGKD